MRCLPNGNFDPLQCFDGICFCYDGVTNSFTSGPFASLMLTDMSCCKQSKFLIFLLIIKDLFVFQASCKVFNENILLYLVIISQYNFLHHPFFVYSNIYTMSFLLSFTIQITFECLTLFFFYHSDYF